MYSHNHTFLYTIHGFYAVNSTGHKFAANSRQDEEMEMSCLGLFTLAFLQMFGFATVIVKMHVWTYCG